MPQPNKPPKPVNFERSKKKVLTAHKERQQALGNHPQESKQQIVRTSPYIRGQQ